MRNLCQETLLDQPSAPAASVLFSIEVQGEVHPGEQ